MTPSIHEHQWVYLADLALVASSRETDVNLRRGEYCIECSSLRVLYPSGWYVMQGKATKEFLEQFAGAAPGGVLVAPPEEFRPRPPKPEPSRLGRGLVDLATRRQSFSPFKKR